MVWVIAGAATGALVGVVARRWRGRGLAVAYGMGTAGLVWLIAGSVAANRADGMGGIMPAVGAGLAFWVVVLPAATAAFVLERRRRSYTGGR